jgi:hypothetical protein
VRALGCVCVCVCACVCEQEVESVVTQARRISTKCRMSTTMRNKLLEEQSAVAANLRKGALADVPTRWNSTCDMLSRLLELRKPVYACLLEQTGSAKDKLIFPTDDAWDAMKVLALTQRDHESLTLRRCRARKSSPYCSPSRTSVTASVATTSRSRPSSRS